VEWKTGFYYLALSTKPPIILIGLDYKNKMVVVDSFIDPSNGEFIEIRDEAIHCLQKYSPNPIYFIPLKN
jgi:1-acyl-sn-glycerol-3-phosphate acyltransferase